MYVVCTHLNCLIETILIIHNIPVFYRRSKKTPIYYSHLSPNLMLWLALWLTLSGSLPISRTYFHCPKDVEPLRFDSRYRSSGCVIQYIMKTRLYNFDPLKPHFYIVKLGFTGVYIIFHISAQNIDCGYSLEPPHRGGSNEYPQSMFLSRNMKNIRIFYLKIFHFWL